MMCQASLSGQLAAKVSYFTDCTATTPGQHAREQNNAVERMADAVAHHLGAITTFVPVPYGSIPRFAQAVLTPALTLVDVLECWRPLQGLAARCRSFVLGNSSPRAELVDEPVNGHPLYWFRVAPTLVLMTVPELLVFAQRLGLVQDVKLTGRDEFLEWTIRADILDRDRADKIRQSQFGGVTLVPLMARLIDAGFKVPGTPVELADPAPPGGKVLRIDAPFGNVIIDALAREVGFRPGRPLLLERLGLVRCYRQLAQVPRDGKPAVVVSDDGYGADRFLMLTIQGGSAAGEFGLDVGDQVLSPAMLPTAQLLADGRR